MSLSIISSKVIGSEQDKFWTANLPEGLPHNPATLLVVTLPYDAGSADEQQLQKMLQACNLSENEYCTLQLQPEEMPAWHKLRDALHPKVVLLLGIQPGALGISAALRLYEPQGFNGATWILSQDLSALGAQPEAKKQLWQNCLKPVFIDHAYGPLS